MFQYTVQEETYITPRYIVDSLGKFDLDPACPSIMPYKTANIMLTKKDDGLSINWSGKGRIWLNPPYGKGISNWTEKFAKEADRGILLMFVRTDTKYFTSLVPNIQHIIFLKGRIRFWDTIGIETKDSSPAASMLLCKNEDETFLKNWCNKYNHTLVKIL